MKRLILVSLFFSGCAASFQPFPSVSRSEMAEALRQRDAKLVEIVQALNKLITQAEAQPKK